MYLRNTGDEPPFWNDNLPTDADHRGIFHITRSGPFWGDRTTGPRCILNALNRPDFDALFPCPSSPPPTEITPYTFNLFLKARD